MHTAVCRGRTALTIRKFTRRYSLEDLVTVGAITPVVATSSRHITDIALETHDHTSEGSSGNETGALRFIHVSRDGLKIQTADVDRSNPRI